jgi:hypothetical protein
MPGHNALEQLNKEAELGHGGKVFDYGTTKPTDGAAGSYVNGAIFIVVGGGDGANLFVNDGTTTSNDFNLVVVTAA